jgi:hypothetical protein
MLPGDFYFDETNGRNHYVKMHFPGIFWVARAISVSEDVIKCTVSPPRFFLRYVLYFPSFMAV